MLKKMILLCNIVFGLIGTSQAQVGIGITVPNASAMLDVTSTTKGILIPRMSTTNRTGISSPAQGLLVYDTDKNTFWYYNSTWHELLTYITNNLTTDSMVIGNGVNYTKIEADGTLEFVGSATVWNEIVVPASAMYSQANLPTWAIFLGYVFTWQFLTAGGELSFAVQMPRDWKEGSAIIPQVHWSPMEGTAGDVRWDIQYTWANYQETFPAPATISQTNTVTLSDAYRHFITSFTPLTHSLTQGQISSVLMIKLLRFPGTTYAGNAALLSFDILYESNTLGSRTAAGK